MFMDIYKKWTLIVSGVYVALWLIFYFALYVPANEIIFYWTIIHFTIMLFYTPLTYGLEYLIKEQFLKYYTRRYIRFRAKIDFVFSILLMVVLVVTIVLIGTSIVYTDLLWFILLSSMLIAIMFATLEANNEV